MSQILELIAALVAGGFIGSVLGFIGAGGAMLTVPILIYGFGFTASQATTSALAVVCSAAIAGSIPKVRAHEILYREVGVIWSFGLLTNIGFSLIAHRLSDRFLATGFAIILIGAATSMLFKPIVNSRRHMPLPLLIVISLGIGAITGLFGIGGGFIAIPVLVLAFGNPMRIAAGTSLAIIAINSITALIAHRASWDQISWRIPITMALSAVVVSAWASKSQPRISTETLKKSFSVLLFSASLFTLIETWWL